MFSSVLLLVLQLLSSFQASIADDLGECRDEGARVDYLIVGAGGGGIQTALLLKQHGHTCKILEKEQTAGHFWTNFPRFRELISVNKRTKNETQRFRFDWHSFLGTDLNMWDVSQDYFPTGSDFHHYINRVADKEGIDIEYGVEVESLATDAPCVHVNGGHAICAKYRVFVGTGLREKEEKYMRAIGGVPYSQLDREMARQKRVCIFGNGNAGFEAAQNTYDVADRVFVFGKHPLRLSAVTKYTGDVRVKFLQALENFHGKLLDSVYEPSHQNIRGKNLNATQLAELNTVVNALLTIDAHQCELLVLATGFRSYVPGVDMQGQRFPPMDDWYAVKENGHMHYVGWLMHAFDFRRGAGGFLSGYRYLIRNLVHRVRELDHGIPYPYHNFTEDEVLVHAAKRFQVSDELVILQDGVVVRDAILTVETGGRTEYHYYEGVTFEFMDSFKHQDDIVYLYFAWGDDRSAGSVFDNAYSYDDTQELRNTKLHPVVEVNGLAREVIEDIDMEFAIGMFVSPVKQMVRDALRKDFSQFHPRPIYKYERMGYNKPKGQPQPESGTDIEYTLNLIRLRKEIERAILADGTEESLHRVRSETVAPCTRLRLWILTTRIFRRVGMRQTTHALDLVRSAGRHRFAAMAMPSIVSTILPSKPAIAWPRRSLDC